MYRARSAIWVGGDYCYSRVSSTGLIMLNVKYEHEPSADAAVVAIS